MENAQQVKIIEKQIEHTHRLIAHKRKIIGTWQNDTIQRVHKVIYSLFSFIQLLANF